MLKAFERRKSQDSVYERSDDQEARDFISQKIDLTALSDNMKSLTFTVGGPELIQALARLVYELRERLLDYDCILSDDASGRIPSLILRRVINLKREESGQSPIPIFFLASGAHTQRPLTSRIEKLLGMPDREDTIYKNPTLKPFLRQKKREGKLGEKVLLSTEAIYSGSSIKEVVDVLEDLDINYDVSTAGLSQEINESRRGNDVSYNLGGIQGEVIYGALGSFSALIHNEASGVTKEPRSVLQPHPKAIRTDSPELKKEIALAREDGRTIASELYRLLGDAPNP